MNKYVCWDGGPGDFYHRIVRGSRVQQMSPKVMD